MSIVCRGPPNNLALTTQTRLKALSVVRCSQLMGDAPDRSKQPRDWRRHIEKIQKFMPTLPGNGDHTVEYSDVVEVANRILDASKDEPRIINAVRTLSCTRKEWYAQCTSKLGLKPISWDPSKPTLDFMKGADVYDVVIVGGGVAGCATAHQLAKKHPDRRIVILEGSGRPGGRVYSTDFGGERGGESIGMHYSRITEMCDELGVAYLKEDLSLLHTGMNINYYTNGEWVTQSEWHQWANHPLKDDSPWKKASPMFLFHMLITKYPCPETWDKHMDCPRLRELASISVKDFVARSDVPKEIVQYIESNNHMINADWAKLPMLIPYITLITSMGFKQDGYFAIKGGNEMLIRALSKDAPLRLRHRVVSDTMDANGTHIVTCSNGEVFRARKVVYALPGNKVKRVRMEPPLRGLQKEALMRSSTR